MQKLKMQLERQIQEIVFFSSVLLGFSIVLSGIFSLVLTPDSLIYIIGSFGSSVVQSVITGLGFSFFYLAVIVLHMGYVINMNVFSFRDFKLQYEMLSITFVAHILILFCAASLFSVAQVSLEMPATEVLRGGLGGLVGYTFGNFFHAHLGVYGSSIILSAVAFGISILAGFYEINDVIDFGKHGAKSALHGFFAVGRGINEATDHLTAILTRDQRMVTANVGFTASKSWMSHSLDKANSYVQERLQKSSSLFAKKSENKEKSSKKAVAKKTSAKPSEKIAEKSAAPKVSNKPASKESLAKATVAKQATKLSEKSTKVKTATSAKAESRTASATAKLSKKTSSKKA